MQAKRLIVFLIVVFGLVLLGFAGAAAADDDLSSTTTTSSPVATSTTVTTLTTAWQVRAIATPVKDAAPSFVSADDNLLAWTGATPAGSRIYVFNVATGKNTAVKHALPGSYYNPCVEGSMVVFQGGKTGTYDDIYLYDAQRDLVSQLTYNTAAGDWNDWNPRIEGQRVVWEKDMLGTNAKPGIYLHDLLSGTTTLVLAGNDYRNPDICGDYLVCVKNVQTGSSTGPATEILLYNLVTKEPPKSIADKTRSNEHPRIDGGRVVWSSGQAWTPGSPDPWLSYQIQLYDIAEDTVTTLTNNVAGNLAPDIKGDTVTWETKMPSSIVAYDIAAATQIGVFLQPDEAHAPDVALFGVAWFGKKGLYTAVPAASATTFPDVPKTYAYHKAIEQMAEREIISGYTTGYFGPEDLVTRQQFAKMIVLARGLTATLNDTYPFTDSASIHRTQGKLYAYHYVARAALSGLIQGYPDGSFKPTRNITRQQAITLIVRAGSTVLQPPPPGYSGALSYSDPTHGSNIRVAESNGILSGIVGPDGGLAGWNTGNHATRGECAQMLWNLAVKLETDG